MKKIFDNGEGMTNDELNVIFKKFKQVGGQNQKQNCTGLGMAITKQIVDILGGDISVSGEKGVGTEFYVYIPLEVADQASIEKKANEFKRSSTPRVHMIKKALIVEDNLINQKYITRLLKKNNLEFSIAKDGQEAIDLCIRETFGIILMDIQMPNLNGFASIKWKRNSTDPQIKNTPIIAVTASTLLNNRQDVIDAGINDYLSKPYTPDQIADAIKPNFATYQNPFESKYNTSTLDASYSVSVIYLEEVDSEYLTLIYNDDISYAFEMFEIFLENIPVEFNLLISTIMQANLEEVQNLDHKIKPTFSMIGLTKENAMISVLKQDAKTSKSLTQYVPILIEVKEEKILIIKLQFEKLKEHL